MEDSNHGPLVQTSAVYLSVKHMKKILIITSVALLIIGIAFGVVWYRSQSTVPTPSGQTVDPFGFGGNETTQPGTFAQSTSLSLSDGSTVSVPAFIDNSQPEWASNEYGYAVSESKDPSYGILYYPNDSGFLISLLTEPLGEARRAAEQELRSKLQLTNAQLCKLKAQVFTSNGVSEVYAGQDLGLSFCPGAVQLP